MTIVTVIACLAYLGFLLFERQRNTVARRALPHVIHVNGIRGKSSICRLIDAGLRAGGFAVFTKTTGTCPSTSPTPPSWCSCGTRASGGCWWTSRCAC